MANLTPNPHNNPPSNMQNQSISSTFGPQITQNSNQYNSQLLQSQPGYPGLKPDPNSNSPNHVSAASSYSNSPVGNMPNTYSNNFNTGSSPAFNKPGMTTTPSQHQNFHPSPNRPPLPTGPSLISSANQMPGNASTQNYFSHSVGGPPGSRPPAGNVGAIQTSDYNKYSPNALPVSSATNQPAPISRPAVFSQSQPIQQINPHMPPLVPSSQSMQSYSFAQPLVNGPPSSTNSMPPNSTQAGLGVYSQISNVRPNMGPPFSTSFVPGANEPPASRPMMPPNHAPVGRPPFPGPPPVNKPPTFSAPGVPNFTGANGPPMRPTMGGPLGPQFSGPPTGPSLTGPVPGPMSESPMSNNSMSGHTMQGPPMGPPSSIGPPLGRPPIGSQSVGPPPGPQSTGPSTGPQYAGPPSGPMQAMYPPSNASQPMPNRYPTNGPPQPNLINHQVPPLLPNMPAGSAAQQYPGQYSAQGVTQQMAQMNVTKAGFNQMWGHQLFDLLQCRHILPEYPEDPPEIRLGNQFAESANCSPEIFRCTVNRIPETNSLLQKSRLPLGILIHPFKDLNHLPVIQCTSIVRCRACRTYINPFVFFVDSKRWKCNLCYRVNDLPEEFQYDPVSKSYGDPTRRPEIKSATIEFIAPGEYMLRPPQPAVYLFLLDISQIARESGYLEAFCETMKSSLDQLPGDARTQVGFICYDSNVHFYLMGEGLTRPREMTVIDIDEVFLPSPESLLVNLGERRELILDLLDVLPKRHATPGVPASALGAALQAAYKLMAPTGGRITIFQTCLPNAGPGALTSREDPNARSSKEVAHLNPATDFYKRLALDCSGAQVAVDLFLINSQYSDLATLSGISKFSGGSVYHIPLFKNSRHWQSIQFRNMLARYLTRKIGFEAVMRVRCTRGIAIHTFHGNFFVRSTDLLSLPNVSPDSAFGMQLTLEESLSDLQQVCFQAALLYTSSKGERRIRVHTLCLPIANNLTDVLHSADQECIIGLLSKMAVDRCQTASMSDAREALSNVAVDALSAHRLAQNLPAGPSATLHAPASLRLLPLYLFALLKHRAFRTGTSTRLDDRVAAMCEMKSAPLAQLLRSVYPDLYPIHNLAEYVPRPPPGEEEEELSPDPPRQHLSAERVNTTGAYLLDDGDTMIIYVGHAVSPAFLSDTFGVASFNQLPDEMRSLPTHSSPGTVLLQSFIDRLNDDRPFAANILIIRDNSPSRLLFTERLVDDRVESSLSYYEFLQHIKAQMK